VAGSLGGDVGRWLEAEELEYGGSWKLRGWSRKVAGS